LADLVGQLGNIPLHRIRLHPPPNTMEGGSVLAALELYREHLLARSVLRREEASHGAGYGRNGTRFLCGNAAKLFRFDNLQAIE